MTKHKTIMVPIRQDWSEYREPALDEILSDPITQAVMRADGVHAGKLDIMLRSVARRMQDARHAEAGVARTVFNPPPAARMNQRSRPPVCR
jgi:hypothetical protein